MYRDMFLITRFTTTDSADFSQFVVTTAYFTACETSPIKVHTLSLHISAASTLLLLTGDSYQSSLLFASLSIAAQPYMRFLFVRPEVCLQLPSDSASRRTPLLFGYTLPTIWACSGLSPVRLYPCRANKYRTVCLYGIILHKYLFFIFWRQTSSAPCLVIYLRHSINRLHRLGFTFENYIRINTEQDINRT